MADTINSDRRKYQKYLEEDSVYTLKKNGLNNEVIINQNLFFEYIRNNGQSLADNSRSLCYDLNILRARHSLSKTSSLVSIAFLV